jgi:hypothetical protein
MTGITELIAQARTNPPKPVIQGLLHESEVVGLHGPPEVFKTMFCIQLAECLANGDKFLGVWQVPRKHRVYFFETEMSTQALGTRLGKMFATVSSPSGVSFASEQQLRQFKRAGTLGDKFKLLNGWVAQSRADVVILDTCNPFFRRKESPNDETTAGAFFDLLEAVPAPTKLFVRHNHKRKLEDNDSDASSKIRGSGQFGDVPDLLLELRRQDKRTNKAELSVTKYRHGSKPDDLALWFDTGDCRLVSLPPVIHLLQRGPHSRFELLALLRSRFDVSQSIADKMIDVERPYLTERMEGHRKVFEINSSSASHADWSDRLERPLGRVQDIQGCINPPLCRENTTNASDSDSVVSESLRVSPEDLIRNSAELQAARLSLGK